jgi:uncharacterized protein (TIGR02271 family)
MTSENSEPETSITRSEEELRVGTEAVSSGTVSVRKWVDRQPVDEAVPRRVETLGDVERVDAYEQDSGDVEVLDDGSVSIPVLEEELVITRRLVVRERVIVRKVTETRVEQIRDELRRERIDVMADPQLMAKDDEGGNDGSA